MLRIVVKIKEIREELNISLRELERRTGIERHYLAELEKMPADQKVIYISDNTMHGISKDEEIQIGDITVTAIKTN